MTKIEIDLNDNQQIVDMLQFAVNTCNAKDTLKIIQDFLNLQDIQLMPNKELMSLFSVVFKAMTVETVIELLNIKYSNAQYSLDFIAQQITKKKS